MAKEYIEREAVIAAIKGLVFQSDIEDSGVYEEINDVPAADVAPVVHAEWIPIVNYLHGKLNGRYYCSACHRVETMKGIYCRLCGAKMDGGNSND